jgi:type I restriction enzyme M protein
VISHDPEELLADYSKQQTDIQILRDQLKGILADALTNNSANPSVSKKGAK